MAALVCGCTSQRSGNGDTSTSSSSATGDTPGGGGGTATSSDGGTAQTTGSTTGTAGPPECGNGVAEGDEDCDDGNQVAGDGCENDCSPTPNRVVGVAGGTFHTCVVFDTGKVRCWGDGFYGQTGRGSQEIIGDDELAKTAGNVDLGADAVAITAGFEHTCALIDGGRVRCWGRGEFGQLGYASLDDVGDDEVPASVGDVDVGGEVAQVVSLGNHTCARLTDGAVRCWGQNAHGQLGYGNVIPIGDNETPASAGDVPIGGKAIDLSTGKFHTCALLEGGDVRCWGYGHTAQLGQGNTGFDCAACSADPVCCIGEDETPDSAPPLSLGGPAKQLAGGGIHNCALLVDGSVRCWGYGQWGALGHATVGACGPYCTSDPSCCIGDDEIPTAIPPVDVGGDVDALVAAGDHTCALMVGGGVRCWGQNTVGRVGYGNEPSTCGTYCSGDALCCIGDDEAPATLGDVAVGGAVETIVGADVRTCAIMETGRLRCWGAGERGALGFGNEDDVGDDETPAEVGDVPAF